MDINKVLLKLVKIHEEIESLATEVKEKGNAQDVLAFAQEIYSLSKRKLVSLTSKICAEGNAEEIYQYALYADGRKIQLASAILEKKDPQYIYLFAKNVKNIEAYVKELAYGLIETGNQEYMFLFAKDIKGAPLLALADAITKTNNPKLILKFAQQVEGAPIEMLADAIIATRDLDCILAFSQTVKDAPVKKLADAFASEEGATKKLGDLFDSLVETFEKE